MNHTDAPADEVIAGEESSARRAWIAWSIMAAISTAIVGLIVGAPLAQATAHPLLAASIYKTFSFVCHQIPERSFHLAGHQFAVCSRCTGLYSGFALAALAYPMFRSPKGTTAPKRIWLILAALPLAVDFALGYFAIWPNTFLSRFVTGALLGSVSLVYILPGLIELSSVVKLRSNRDKVAIPHGQHRTEP